MRWGCLPTAEEMLEFIDGTRAPVYSTSIDPGTEKWEVVTGYSERRAYALEAAIALAMDDHRSCIEEGILEAEWRYTGD